jgi:hypothetical protein
VDKEYTAAEAKAWLNGYDEGKKIRTSERSIQISDSKEAESARSWVGLTDDELHALHYELKVQTMGGISTLGMYRILEQALKEKNNG